MFPEWYEKAEKLFLEGKTYVEIGKELSVGRKTISHWLRKGGHKTDPKNVRNTTPLRTYSLDENVFETIDTEEKAYWLGFLYADGYVSDAKNDIEIGLAKKDMAHLEKAKLFFDTDRPLHKKTKRTGEKEYVGYRLIITSQKLKTDLINKGCVNKKSLILKFPTEKQVPKTLLPHFVRGYFDGDGSVTHANKGRQIAAEILGASDFIDGLIDWVDCSPTKHSFNHSVRTFRIQLFGPKAHVFFEKIYKDATIYLDRKYAKYVNFAPPMSNCGSEPIKIGEA